MQRKLVFLLQDRPKKNTRGFNPWTPTEVFENEDDAKRGKLIEEASTPDHEFKLTQIPFTSV